MTVRNISSHPDTSLVLRNPNAPFAEAAASVDFFAVPKEILWPNPIGPDHADDFPATASPPEAIDLPSIEAIDELQLPDRIPSPGLEPVASNDVNLIVTSQDAELASDIPASLDQAAATPTDVTFKVCSRHLIESSEVFAKQLLGPWKEGSKTAEGHYVLDTQDWDPEALQILLHIIHSKNYIVPKDITLELLAKVAVLIDYYNCHEAVHVYYEVWSKNLRTSFHDVYNRDLILWICIASVFKETDLTLRAVKVIVQHATGPLPTLLLPIPARLVDAVNGYRLTWVGRIIDALREHQERLVSGNVGCSDACTSMVLGSLLRIKRKAGLPDGQVEAPYIGHSVIAMMKLVSEFQTPTWCDPHFTKKIHHGKCEAVRAISSTADRIPKEMEALSIENFQ